MIVTGIDIGTTKIACFMGERLENGKTKILGYASTPSQGVQYGKVFNVQQAARGIQKVTEEVVRKTNRPIEDVYVGIADRHIRYTTNTQRVYIQNPEGLITNEDVRKLCSLQMQYCPQPGMKIIHVFPQKYRVNEKEIPRKMDPVGMAGNVLDCEFLVTLSDCVGIQNIIKAVEMVEVQGHKLHVVDTVLEPIASAAAVFGENELSSGVILVDIGGGTSDIAVFTEGRARHLSVVPMAGNSITADIAHDFRILNDQAERLKVSQFGDCLNIDATREAIISIPNGQYGKTEVSSRSLREVIHRRTKIILECVRVDLIDHGFTPTSQEYSFGNGIVLTGGGSSLTHIDQLCQALTGFSTHIGNPTLHLDTSDSNNNVNINDLKDPRNATAIGLVLYGLDTEVENASTQEELKKGPETTVEEPPTEDPKQPEDIITPDPDETDDDKKINSNRNPLKGMVNWFRNITQ